MMAVSYSIIKSRGKSDRFLFVMKQLTRKQAQDFLKHVEPERGEQYVAVRVDMSKKVFALDVGATYWRNGRRVVRWDDDGIGE